jgi:transcriptional regulator with XRE-family HTH domain
MSRETVARNLTRLVNRSHLSRRQLADSVGLSDKTLWRWMQEAVDRTNGKNGEKLEALCQKLGIPVGVLSCTQMSQADICAKKVREMVQIWEHEGIGFEWIHVWHCAAIAVRRLKQERPEIWQQVCRIMNLASDREAYSELEKWARKRAEQEGLDAEAVYQSLFKWAALLSDD